MCELCGSDTTSPGDTSVVTALFPWGPDTLEFSVYRRQAHCVNYVPEVSEVRFPSLNFSVVFIDTTQTLVTSCP